MRLLEDIRSNESRPANVPDGVRTRVIQKLSHDTRYGSVRARALFASCVAKTSDGTLEDDVVEFRAIVELAEAAVQCDNQMMPESHWNSEIHHPLIKIALTAGRWKQRGISCCNVTSARIAGKDLLLKQAQSGKINMGKIVDFALVIENLEYECRERLRDKTKQYSISYSDAEHLRCSPIAISIETKTAGGIEEEARAQLGTWVHAHFKRLENLSERPVNTPLPTLPLIMVQGHEWRLMFAEKPEDEIYIYQSVSLGETASILGIYQIIASMSKLAAYANDVYRPWLIKNVLKMVVADS